VENGNVYGVTNRLDDNRSQPFDYDGLKANTDTIFYYDPAIG